MSRQRLHQLNRERLATGQFAIVATDYHCTYLGEFERHTACKCPSKRVPAFECDLHGLCTVQRPTTEHGVPWCETCNNYFPRTE